MQAAIEPAGSDKSLTLVLLGLIAGVIGPFVMVVYLAHKLSQARHACRRARVSR
jgi:hypothetical protein